MPLVYEELRRLAAAEAMRRILIDQARTRKAAKRGGEARRVDLDLHQLAAAPGDDGLEALGEALSRFAAEYLQQADLVQLKFFGQQTMEQCAEVLGVSPRKADTWWAYVRACLGVAMRRMEQSFG